MDLISRLKLFLDSRGISVTQFADECAIPRPTASQLLAGRNKKVSDEIINKIHTAYPTLSIVWLMFGEGDMESTPNIEVSTPQNAGLFAVYDSQPAVTQQVANANTPSEKPSPADPEKFENKFPSAASLHTFSFDPDEATDPAIPDPARPTPSPAGRRVTGIVVYYDDNTYESFIPDPEHRNPFMR